MGASRRSGSVWVGLGCDRWDAIFKALKRALKQDMNALKKALRKNLCNNIMLYYESFYT